MINTYLETAVESSVGTSTTSEIVDENSPIIGECSEVVVETLPMIGDSLSSETSNVETSEMTGDLSAMTVEDVNARVAPRITDEIPAPHSWICRRPMLRLHDPHHEGNLLAFQSRWEKGEVSKDMAG